MNFVYLSAAVWLCQTTLNNRCSTHFILRKLFLRPLRALYTEVILILSSSSLNPFSIDIIDKHKLSYITFLNIDWGE